MPTTDIKNKFRSVSGGKLLDADLIEETTDAKVMTATERVTGEKVSRGLMRPNQIRNGNLSKAADGVLWYFTGSAPVYDTSADTVFNALGIKRVLNFAAGGAGMTQQALKQDFGRNIGGEYLIASFYVYSSDGVTWPTNGPSSQTLYRGISSAGGVVNFDASLTYGYSQIDGNHRRYWSHGLINAADVRALVIGLGSVPAGATTRIGGFSANVSGEPVGDETELQYADWTATSYSAQVEGEIFVQWNGAAPVYDRTGGQIKFPAGVWRRKGDYSTGNVAFAAQNIAVINTSSANNFYLDTTDATIKALASGVLPPNDKRYVLLGTLYGGLWTPHKTAPLIDNESALTNVNSLTLGDEVLVDLDDTLMSGAPSIYVPRWLRWSLPGSVGISSAVIGNALVWNPIGGYCRIAVSTTLVQQTIWYDAADNTVKLATHPTRVQATGNTPGLRIMEFSGTENSIRMPTGIKWRSLGKRQQNGKGDLAARLRSENHSVILAQMGDSNSVAEGADAEETFIIPGAPYQVNLQVYGQRGFTSVIANGVTLAKVSGAPASGQYSVSDWATAADGKGRTLTFNAAQTGQTVVVIYSPEIAPRGHFPYDTRYPLSGKTWCRQWARQMAMIACGAQNEAFVSKTEAKTVASGYVTLSYAPAPGSVVIAGFTEVIGAVSPASGQFRVSTSSPGRLEFNAADNGAALSITYGIAGAVRYSRSNVVATYSSNGFASSIFSVLDSTGQKVAPTKYSNNGSSQKAMVDFSASSALQLYFEFTGDRFDVTHAKFAGIAGTWAIYVDDVLNATINLDVDGSTAFGYVTSVTGLTFGFHRVRLVQQSTAGNLRIESVTFYKTFEHWNISSYGSNTSEWLSGSSSGLLAAAVPSHATDTVNMLGTNDRLLTTTTTDPAAPHLTKSNHRAISAWLTANRARARQFLVLPPKAFGASDIYGGGGFYASSDDVARGVQQVAADLGLDTFSYYDAVARYEIENGSVPSSEGWPNGLHFKQAVQSAVAADFATQIYRR